MNSKTYNVIALMSGTSLDGIDICYLSLVRDQNWSFQIQISKTISYSETWKELLQNALNNSNLKMLDQRYTSYLGGIINSFLKEHAINDVIAICSHGHTVLHEPKKGVTLQIGNLPDIAKITGVRTICDFRIQDVSLGGQGAPLVPIGDKLLFNEYDYCLNLGGFANISFEQNGKQIAYDICPVNVVLNHYSNILGSEYDENGAFAKAGTINTTVLNELNGLEYYHRDAPKSLGMEWVQKFIYPILNKVKDPKDAIATFTAHASQQIALHLKTGNVLVTGGGAYNSYLIASVRNKTLVHIVIPENELIEYKEAVIFGLLGVLRLRNENNCLSSVTGAVKDHCSGVIHLP